MRVRLALLGLPLLLVSTACLPYTVGSTAHTVPLGQTTSSTTWYFIPNALKAPGDTVAAPLAGVDREWRHGLDDRSDIGLRLTSGLGAVVNYKRRVRDYGEGGGPALAYILGTGIVNAGEHMHLEATLVASGDEAASVMPFGGIRAMQVIPITAGAVNDSPTIGVFGGVQLGDASLTLRPEVGLFYDHSALGVRSGNIIVVPAVTIQRGRRASGPLRQVRPDADGARGVDGPRSLGRMIRCAFVGCGESTSGRESAARGSTPVLH